LRIAGLNGFHFAWRGWILAALLAALAFVRFRTQAPLQPGWLALLAAGLAWRAWAGFHIGGHSNGDAFSGPELAAGGPYRISRHPLYFANLLCAAGIVLYAHCLPAWAALAVLSLAAAHHEALARAEERFLLARDGAGYLGYMQVTPRWPIVVRRSAPGRKGEEQADARLTGARWTGGERADVGLTGTGQAGAGPLDGWRSAFARQGWNLAKACACAIIIRIAAGAAG
jgi:protein-S-isoprenylcysteine O-methyltransferase Ste14